MRLAPACSVRVRGRPGQQLIGRQRVDDRSRSCTPHPTPARSRCGATPAGRARGHPSRSLTRHPASTARRSSRFGGSSRSGRRVHLDRLVEARRGGEHDLGVERRRRPVSSPRLHPAGAVAEDVEVRVGERGHHAARHRSCGHPQLANGRCRRRCPGGSSSSGVWSSEPVLEDVDLDPGQDAERRQLRVQRRDLVQLRSEPLRRQPVGDRQASASGRSAPCTRGRARSPSRPSRGSASRRRDQSECDVAVASERLAESCRALSATGWSRRSPPADGGRPAPRRAGSRGSCAPSPRRCRSGSRSVAVLARARRARRGRSSATRGRRVAEGAHAIRRLAGSLQQEGDPPQVGDRVARGGHGR